MKGIVLTAMDDEIYEVLSDNEIFADLFNGALFGGNQIIRPDMLEQENEKKVMRVGKEGGRRVILRRIRDVQKLSGLRESCLAVVLAAEGQRNVHYAMPVRCMLYDAMDYTRQVERMVKKRREEGKLEKGAEYLSGMKREDRLLPVITIVFYYGEEQSWDGPLCLHDMLDIPPELEPWAACIQDYRVNLVCSGTVESSHFRTGLREVFELLPLLKDKEGMKKFLETRKREFMHLDAKKGWLVSKFLNVPALKELKENEKGEVNMCTAIEEMLEERETQGIERGIERGIEQGEIRVNQLIEVLLRQSELDEAYKQIKRAVTDRDYQKKLFDKYGI